VKLKTIFMCARCDVAMFADKQIDGGFQQPAAANLQQHHKTPAAQPVTEATPARQPPVSQEARQQVRKYHVLVVQEGNIYMSGRCASFTTGMHQGT
jgi:hypothetical protein